MDQLSTLNRVILWYFYFHLQPNQCYAKGSQDTTSSQNEIFLLPRDAVSACPGEQVTFMCVTNATSVRWNITVPLIENGVVERVISQTTTRMIKSANITSDTLFMFSRTSDVGTVPFESTLFITNITNKLNGTTVKCHERIFQAVNTLHVIRSGDEVYPLSLELKKTEVFTANGISVLLEWEEEAGVTYNADILPPSPLMLARGSVQLMLSYNIIYNVSITSTLCGQNNSTTTKTLNYFKCADIFKEVLVHSADRDIYLEGTNITLTCPPGQVLIGHNSSMCVNGEWERNPNLTECKADCGVPMEKDSVNLIFNSTLEGSELRFWCDESPNDTINASCNSDGRWSVDTDGYSCKHQLGNNLSSLTLPLVTASGIGILLVITITVIVVTIKIREWSNRKLQLRGNTSINEYHVTRHQSERLAQSEYSLVQYYSTSEEVEVNSGTEYLHDEVQNSRRKNLVYADVTPQSLHSQSCTSTLVDIENYKVEYVQLNHSSSARVETQTVELPAQQECGEPDTLLNLDSLLIQLRPHVTTSWYVFGKAIGVKKKVLDECQQYSPEESLITILDNWLRTEEHPTWHTVATALKKIGLQKLALEIERVYDTGMLPIQVDMNWIPQTMQLDSAEDLPPPVPPRLLD